MPNVKVGERVSLKKDLIGATTGIKFASKGDIGKVIPTPSLVPREYLDVVYVDFNNQGNEEVFLDGIWCVYQPNVIEGVI